MRSGRYEEESPAGSAGDGLLGEAGIRSNDPALAQAKKALLVVDDEKHVTDSLASGLADEAFRVDIINDPEEVATSMSRMTIWASSTSGCRR